MRRTYMSKKDSASVIDRRDLLQNLGEKSSIYEAFSIKNIKQTKREISCVGTRVASSRVRKKKYVKRIVKETETPYRESMSQSAYLTPDKSIHVNKPLDPFDLLLMSSPLNSAVPNNVKFLPSQETPLFNKCEFRKETKKYCRKKAKKITRLINSSTDSLESDKENSDGRSNLTCNTSDIRTHKFLVELEHKLSPESNNDSIHNVVNNVALLNKLQNKNANESINRLFQLNEHRLTRNICPPSTVESPLCSTPFKKKVRVDSIFKFSPISATNDDNEKKTKDKVLHNIDDDRTDKSIFENPSLSLELPPNINNDYKEDNSKLGLDVSTEEVLPNMEKSHLCKEFLINSACGETSLYQCTEIEPFLGFSQNEISETTSHPMTNINNNNNLFVDNTVSKIEELDAIKNKISEYYNILEEKCQSNINLKINTNIIVIEENYTEDTITTDIDHEKTINLSSQSENFEIQSDGINSSTSTTKIEVQEQPTKFCKEIKKGENERIQIEKSLINQHEDSSLFSEEEIVKYNSIKNKTSDEDNIEFISDNSLSESAEKNSLYDTCTSEQSFIQEKQFIKEPVVLVQKLRDSLLYNFYCNNNGNLETSTNEFVDIQSNNCLSESSNALEIGEEKYSSENESDNSNDIEKSNSDEDSNNEADTSISFVTTRRRNEVTNNSIVTIFDNSYYSTSTDCNETVVSNNIENQNSLVSEHVTDNNITVLDLDITPIEQSDVNKNLDAVNTNYEEPRISFVTIDRKMSMRRSKHSIRQSNSTIFPENPTLHKKNIVQDCNISRFNNLTLIDLDNNVTNDEELVRNKDSIIDEGPRISFVNLDRKRPVSNKKSIAHINSTKLMEKPSHQENINQNYEVSSSTFCETKPGIVLKPGKKWERSLSIYRRMTMMNDNFDRSILDEETTKSKGRKYRQSVISTIAMQDLDGSLHNESISSRRSTFVSKPSRSTIRIVKDLNSSRLSLCNTTVFDDLEGFLNEECDDTFIEISKLSIGDQSHEVTVIDNFHDTSNRIATARDYVLRRCNQTDTILFDECYPDADLKNCHKIGEGVYGEVFLWRARDGIARVLKIVPIAGSIKVNGESQKDFHEIISEIVIAMELSALRAPIAEIERHLDEGKDVEALDLHAIENATDVFNEVLAVRCVYGSYPSRLLDLWDLYDECKGSENDNPAILPVDQQYIVLELANAGQDLESYQFNNAEQAHALFLQVAYGLAVAEEAFQFEHRDLHWGNVLISPTEQKYATFVIRGRAVRVARCGVRGAIIDYSLSRVALRLTGHHHSHHPHHHAALYNDLAQDDSLFDALGDYQFDVYRLMRDKLRNDWKNFEPYTNILWLHYTVDKMITALRYKRTNTKIHKHYIDKLKRIKGRILDYGSAAQFVLTDNEI